MHTRKVEDWTELVRCLLTFPPLYETRLSLSLGSCHILLVPPPGPSLGSHFLTPTLFYTLLHQGLSDLSHGLIRTPLPPSQTFDDDPLRILRCIRFASRYGFTLHSDISASLEDENIRKALRERISRERVGIEIEKMFAGECERIPHAILYNVISWPMIPAQHTLFILLLDLVPFCLSLHSTNPRCLVPVSYFKVPTP